MSKCSRDSTKKSISLLYEVIRCMLLKVHTLDLVFDVNESMQYPILMNLQLKTVFGFWFKTPLPHEFYQS